jgi:hypothetical protein
LDDLLPWTIVDFVQLAVDMLGTMIVAVVVNFWVVLAILPLLVYLAHLRQYYLKTAREIKRLDAVARSPVYSHFRSGCLACGVPRAGVAHIARCGCSASLEGAVVIRAYGRVGETIHRMHE